ncbi:hypothetical protein DMP14_19300 [Pseudonocardia sp. Ae707_Ps2]
MRRRGVATVVRRDLGAVPGRRAAVPCLVPQVRTVVAAGVIGRAGSSWPVRTGRAGALRRSFVHPEHPLHWSARAGRPCRAEERHVPAHPAATTALGFR